MKLVIVTGMSGAGKTIALKMLEDIGFYCVDNLPIPLVEKFAQLTLSNPGGFKEIALGIDIRSGEELS
ncbi:MAG: RNase adapter RapZ, partial [Hungatella sp.]